MLGDVGINVQQMQDVNLDINPIVQNDNMADDQVPDDDDHMDIDVMENRVTAPRSAPGHCHLRSVGQYGQLAQSYWACCVS